MKIAPCPYCESQNPGSCVDVAEEHTVYFVECCMCWAHGPVKSDLLQSIIEWNRVSKLCEGKEVKCNER